LRTPPLRATDVLEPASLARQQVQATETVLQVPQVLQLITGRHRRDRARPLVQVDR
jgi:hypothetical protein